MYAESLRKVTFHSNKLFFGDFSAMHYDHMYPSTAKIDSHILSVTKYPEIGLNVANMFLEKNKKIYLFEIELFKLDVIFMKVRIKKENPNIN